MSASHFRHGGKVQGGGFATERCEASGPNSIPACLVVSGSVSRLMALQSA